VVDCFARILADARRAIVAVCVEDIETETTNKMVLLARQGGLTGTIYSVGWMDSTNKQALSKLPRFSTARAQKSKQ